MPRAFAIYLVFLLAAAGRCPATPQSSSSPENRNDGLTTAAPESVGVAAKPLHDMDAAVRAGEFKKIGSVLVARHGKLVFEDYFDGDAGTLRDTRSATKSITDVLVGIAIGEKKLSGLDARVLALLPERERKMQNPDPRKEKITVEDFLTMSSPLECDDWNDASRGNEERMYLVEDWAQFILDLPVRGRMHVGEQADPPKYGRYFSYCTGGVFTLSELLQKATGERTDRYAQERALRTAGNLRCKVGVFALECSANRGWTSTEQPRSGQDRGTLPLGRPLAGKIHCRRSVGERLRQQAHAQIDDQTEYGYLWWLKSFQSGGKGYPAFFMSGNGGNKIAVFPGLDLTVVITSTNYGTRGMHEQTEKLLTDYILPAVGP